MVQGDVDGLRVRVATEEQSQLWNLPDQGLYQLSCSCSTPSAATSPSKSSSSLWRKLGISTSSSSSTNCISGFTECTPTSTRRFTNSRQ
eukprot:5190945-Amphidinium_carterae.1